VTRGQAASHSKKPETLAQSAPTTADHQATRAANQDTLDVEIGAFRQLGRYETPARVNGASSSPAQVGVARYFLLGTGFCRLNCQGRASARTCAALARQETELALPAGRA
jgi:hypothetical protein